MPNIDAEVSGTTSNSYLTLEEADERLNEFEQFDRWDELEADDRARLLFRAARLVDRYKDRWPPPAIGGQRLVFPTSKDPAGKIPEQVKTAVLEIIDHLLEGSMEPLKKLQAEGVTSMNMLGQSVNVSDFATAPMDRSQIPAGARRELDRLWSRYQTPQIQQRPYDGSEDVDQSSIFG